MFFIMKKFQVGVTLDNVIKNPDGSVKFIQDQQVADDLAAQLTAETSVQHTAYKNHAYKIC